MSALKSWQVFVLSLLPVILVFAGVIGGPRLVGGSSGGGAPTPAANASAPATPVDGVLQLTAKGTKFSPRALAAPAGSQVTIHFSNQDKGLLHNVSVYTDKTASKAIFTGQLITGPATADYTFAAPAAGSYFFRCDAHPDMTGTLTIQ